MNSHLDKIHNLGFQVHINWNESLHIQYESDVDSTYSFNVLVCAYHKHRDFTFIDMVESACDMFYEWYNKNLNNIRCVKNLQDFVDLHDHYLGDVTVDIYRDYNIDSILQ